MNENKICPKCGSTNTRDHFICINDKFASTYPIKHNWRCHDCGWDDRKPKTNLDRVRKMSAEEMARWLWSCKCPPGFFCLFNPETERDEDRCRPCWERWLEKEV